MRFDHVHVQAFGHALPEEVVTSDALDALGRYSQVITSTALSTMTMAAHSRRLNGPSFSYSARARSRKPGITSRSGGNTTRM